MNLIRAGLNCSDRVDDTQTAILMPVPIEPDVATLFLDNVLHKSNHRPRAIRSWMSDGVADADSLRSALNGSRIERANCFRVCPRSIFGDIHHGHSFTDGKSHRLFSQFQQLVDGPVFRKESYSGRTNKSAGFDRNARSLRDFDNRQDVVTVSAGRAVRPNLELFRDYLTRH